MDYTTRQQIKVIKFISIIVGSVIHFFAGRVRFYVNLKTFLKTIAGYSILKVLLLINNQFKMLYVFFIMIGSTVIYLQFKLDSVTKRNFIYVFLFVFIELLVIYQIEN
jgi:hypothetical protein